MFYDFPSDLTLAEVRRVVTDHNARCGTNFFIEKDCGDHCIFNYLVASGDSFPQPDTDDAALNRDYAILRECRGLIMSKSTGEVLARRFHKFFNVNEKAFTQAHLIDWSVPHRVLLKLDGSMITPFMTDDGLRWGTKMGVTDVATPVAEFVQARPAYICLALDAIGSSMTPIFEWCSRQQKIVIDYPEDQLILTAVRRNGDGSYLTPDEMDAFAAPFGIPVVTAEDGQIGDIAAFLASTRCLKDTEGFVIRFDNGHMLKVKADEYCAIHGTKETLDSEKDVWALILNDQMDDAMALMDLEDRERCERFVAAMNLAIAAAGTKLLELVEAYREISTDKKDFALFLKGSSYEAAEHGLKFMVWDGKDAVEVVRNYLKKNVSTSTKVDVARKLVGGLRWSDYRHTTSNEVN